MTDEQKSVNSICDSEGDREDERRTGERFGNRISISGTVMRKYVRPDYTRLVVRTKVNEMIANYPAVMFFGESRESAANIREGSRVCITGKISSYDREKLKPFQSQFLLVGTHVSEEAVRTEAGSGSSPDYVPIEPARCDDRNEMELLGRITSIGQDRSGNITVTVRTSAFRPEEISCLYFARNRKEFFRKVYVGQYVKGTGSVQTANVPDIKTGEQKPVRSSVRPEMGDTIFRVRRRTYFVISELYEQS